MSNNIVILYTTVGEVKDAEELSHLALSNYVAACVNIIPVGKSLYLWDGKIEESSECYIIFKTTIEKVYELERLLMENHPYDTPAILQFHAESSEKFFNYINKSLSCL